MKTTTATEKVINDNVLIFAQIQCLETISELKEHMDQLNNPYYFEKFSAEVETYNNGYTVKINSRGNYLNYIKEIESENLSEERKQFWNKLLILTSVSAQPESFFKANFEEGKATLSFNTPITFKKEGVETYGYFASKKLSKKQDIVDELKAFSKIVKAQVNELLNSMNH